MLELDRLDGRTVAVTGATSGIGYFIAERLAELGAEVIVVARSGTRGRRAIDLLPHSARHRFLQMDLAVVDSVRHAGAELRDVPRLDGLVMNAGVIAPPTTFQNGPFGVEVTMGTNVLSHVELLRIALPAMERTPGARIVSMGSMLTRRIPFDPENWLAQRTYRPRTAYAMSKHATEILGFELSRRLRTRHSEVESIVAHPGGAIDALTADRPGIHTRSIVVRAAARMLGPAFSSIVQGKDSAAASAVAAVAAHDLPHGAVYIGPRRNAAGTPVLAEPVQTSHDPELGAFLWGETERIIGTRVFM
ncbi:SDR family NAD(P)-dependent oxidoreductase [Rhodococcus sp. BP-349]|uniref:SDR family NAD(P)-dependent oxidoreductase n=1 Tax=unclassified Rhodococcus (in: high G+C Gram-positive bacteria) TaxID=192944 RepID=UPI001C9B8D19|nr:MULTISPECIES: SDR family NAD(P)-dependent oxidoreductase [unclassified Rhodococcus (in: high G+C Gram-positive bacteria)]MBY6537851.1 SDR family NAD(P)-dependent oxidoreductase [Rhodococcus sp. BP-363]MBY6542188.1 SDR family NAD(P)-dependent oxidoreductase [Rhodococcus sp. BP-369]MBY6561418.1 SDR family NAD(P)-dependent oxidoreductase [Rhodococcus sp. BP-370]MBY6575710.1 SDR family NAD(P)-dependent oxidoreductase [Rhodococcus sp. BP-364]MBY6585011.1 SDR family NAD(P)-dependent oxidoreductas